MGKQHREQLVSLVGLVEPAHGQNESSVQLLIAPIGLQDLYTFPRNLQSMVQQALAFPDQFFQLQTTRCDQQGWEEIVTS